jgi:hypothetical protein
MYRSRLVSALAMAALATILLPSSLPAQITFERTYGGTDDDEGYAVRQTTDGGYIIAGRTISFDAGHDDVYLIKTDVHGDTLWSKTLGSTDHGCGNSVQQTTDGGYIIAGTATLHGASHCDIYLIRTDANGDTLWTRAFGGTSYDIGNSVQQTADGGFIIAGWTMSYGAGGYDVYLIKTNGRGIARWTRTFGGRQDDYGCSVRQTADGGYVIAGETESFGSSHYNIWLVKTDANGAALWTRTFHGLIWGHDASVQQTTDGGYVIVGLIAPYGSDHFDACLIKVDPRGGTLWTKTYGGSNDDEGLSVQQTTDGGYIVAGCSWSFGAGGPDVYLVKTDANGDTLWTRTFGGRWFDFSYSVQQTTDGGFIIVGYTDSLGAGGADVYLIKTDSLGDVAVAEPKTNPTRALALSLTCEPNPCRGATRIGLKLQAPDAAHL